MCAGAWAEAADDLTGGHMPNLVLLDTNAWFAESLLRSSVGAAVVYALSTTRSSLAIPDVVEREVVSLVTRTCRELINATTDAKRKIRELTGRHVGVDGPIEDVHIRSSVEDRFVELGNLLRRIETPSDAYHRAFDRVIDCKVPNSEKNQQAKDSLLWECILTLGRDAQVIFVT